MAKELDEHAVTYSVGSRATRSASSSRSCCRPRLHRPVAPRDPPHVGQMGGGAGAGSCPSASRRPRSTSRPTPRPRSRTSRRGRGEGRARRDRQLPQGPEVVRPLGARMPKGVLLVGPPGTGKTLLAKRWPARPACRSSRSPARSSWRCSWRRRRARARPLRAGSPEGARHHLHRRAGRARRARPRSPAWRAGHDEKEQTLNQLLVAGRLRPTSGIVLLAATNGPRSSTGAAPGGRFDRQVLVDRPTARARGRSSACT